MRRTIMVGDVEFTVRKGADECELEVVDGDNVGQVSWHPATQRFRGSFNGWWSGAGTVEDAVPIAARRIIETRQGISQDDACKAMQAYLDDDELAKNNQRIEKEANRG